MAPGSMMNSASACISSLRARAADHSLPGGLAIDDTWRDAGVWHGKGARAVPWLLEQGWPLLEAAERAVVFLKPENAAQER